MGKVNAWLMAMESLAEEAIANELSEKTAIVFMKQHLEKSHNNSQTYKTSEKTLQDVYQHVRERYASKDL